MDLKENKKEIIYKLSRKGWKEEYNTPYQPLWNIMTAVLRRKLMATNAFIIKEKNLKNRRIKNSLKLDY